MIKKIPYILMLLFSVQSIKAEKVVVFPVNGINVDRSFADAFGALLANKYQTISGAEVVSPIKSVRLITADSNLTAATKGVNADEYFEIDAVGLYVSRNEKNQVFTDSSSGQKIVIHLNKDNDDDDDDDDDQALLDNQKTIVTVSRIQNDGILIHKVEMTLLTYGDIEESTDRIAQALFQKVSVNDVRSTTNITRREGMDNNKLFVDKIGGVKLGIVYGVAKDTKLAPFVTLGYDMRLESENFFFELGAGGRIPSGLTQSDSIRVYGGNYFELGGSYYFLNGVVGLYGGGGVIPYFNWLDDLKFQIAPYLQVGVSMPRNSRTRFFIDCRVAQNLFPVYTGGGDYYDSYSYRSFSIPKTKSYPFELAIQMGIGW